ncbi:hypothetical protein Y1Q_0015150 [Alligator mississippiensis]|uniref:Uncharacterized protein n=1 Tax=Alligator mississippiensis TaxID=8496 RepID=A0A151P8S4_ALLMI|nr:hypothetical protein Y1Q_0015150 [Alligator mississippiensis]
MCPWSLAKAKLEADDTTGSQTTPLQPGTDSEHWECLPHPSGLAAAQGGDPPATGEEAAARMLPPLTSVHRMCCLYQWCTQDSILLLDQLVTVLDEKLVDSWAWLAEAQDQQGTMVAQVVVVVTDEDQQIRNTVLALAVSFVPPNVLPVSCSPVAPGSQLEPSTKPPVGLGGSAVLPALARVPYPSS